MLSPSFERIGVVALGAFLLAGCSMTNQLHAELTYRQVTDGVVSLEGDGVGVLTPSAPTGQESDRQALGDALSRALEDNAADGRVVSMPAMLSAINQAGLAEQYAEMLAEYEDTGILERDRLRRVAEAGGVRYLAKLTLGGFAQTKDERFDLLGVRLFDTWRATLRVHLEIWDSAHGIIAWQGSEELVLAQERVREKPVTFGQVAILASERLVQRVGDSGGEMLDEIPPAVADAAIDVGRVAEPLGAQR